MEEMEGNLLGMTYAPNRIQMEPMNDPNIIMKPMKSQRRAPGVPETHQV